MSDTGAPLSGPVAFAAQTGVSRETIHRLSTYAALLAEWQGRMNLVAPSTLADVWRRHFLDSAQLLPLVPPEATRLIDLGSGAGFPGLVLAVLLAERPGLQVTLIEATQKRARFLEAVIAATGAPAQVLATRIEATPPLRADVVTARACAPLTDLLAYVRRFIAPAGVALLPKGRAAAEELAAAQRVWTFRHDLVKSITDPDSTILVVRPPLVRR